VRAGAGGAVGRLLISRGGRAGSVLAAGAAGSLGTDAARSSISSGVALAAFLVAAAAFLAAAGSSGDTSRRSPSASAFRRTRSAWASSMEDE
jgi:hypothetical protein